MVEHVDQASDDYVQTSSVPITRAIVDLNRIYISVWAVNKVMTTYLGRC